MKFYVQNLIKTGGAISISQFMNEALFHPKLGYYKEQNPFGKKGDFITAPEISQVFGEIIGVYLINLWQNNYSRKKINLVEMGAGRGTLIKDLLSFAHKIPDFKEKFTISIIEISPKLQEIQKKNLQDFDIFWYQNFSSFYERSNQDPIFYISNELFDCFAINQLVKTKNSWAEKVVTIGDDEELQFALQTSFIKPENDSFAKIGDVFEYSPDALKFMNELSIAVKKTNGIAIIVDYGYVQNEFKNTLQAVKKHQYSDILKNIGESDITALVDFSSLSKIALKNNLQTSIVSQREFLLSCGIEVRRKKLLEGEGLESQKEINGAIDRLTDSKQMGDLFKVMICW